MIMADDALKCIESLLECVPSWIADLETILKTAAETQEETLFARQPAASVSRASKNDSKTSSLKSNRSSDVRKDNEHLRPQLAHMTNSDALRLSQRKRKTTSVCSGSGPARFRNRSLAVVFYDGETQKGFEKLVRAVGACRNSIRKGKMSAKVDMLSRTGSSSSEASNSSGREDEDFNDITAGLKYRSSRARVPGSGGDDGSEAFDRVDGQLEKGQLLCERAAHQILRDGDCTLEINNAKEHFVEAQKLAQAELPTLQKKAQQAAARKRRHDERRRVEEELEERQRATDAALDQKAHAISINMTLPSQGKLEVDELEVDDDSDDDDGELDLSDMRLGRFAQMRTTRLAVH